MKHGFLSQYFEGVAAKRLSRVEADVLRSNQHEFNSHQTLKQLLGAPAEAEYYATRFLYLSDQDDEPVLDDGTLTWYDSRKKGREERDTKRSPEYRLYFTTNAALQCATEGDLLLIAKRPERHLLAIVCEQHSTVGQQLQWLFGLGDLSHPGFSVKSEMETEQDRIGFASRVVLESIGFQLVESAPNLLEDMLERFGGSFPTTAEFSNHARGTLSNLDPSTDPDGALMACMEREEILFRTLEKHLLGNALRAMPQGPANDPDAYMALTMSFIQRRKSRAGSAFESHLSFVFGKNGLHYSRGQATEGRLKPDFLLPGITHYLDGGFPAHRLTMLAAKTTCKDRWRQILNEAVRIPVKHLVTLEPSISEHQTAEMQKECVQLVVPFALHETFTAKQREWLWTVRAFIDEAKRRQNDQSTAGNP